MFCVATILLNVAYSTFSMHIVNKAIFGGIDKQKAAMIPSLSGICNTAGRLVAGLVTARFSINKLIWYGAGTLSIGVTFMLMNVSDSYANIMTWTAISSFSVGKSYSIT